METQFLTLHIYFSHPSLVVYFVASCNPTPETEIGTAKRSGTTNSKPPGPIIMMGQSETLTSSQITFTTQSSAGAHGYYGIILNQNHFPEPDRHIWTSKFSVQDNTEHRWRCPNRPTTGNFPLLDLHW